MESHRRGRADECVGQAAMNRRGFLTIAAAPLYAAEWPRFGGPTSDFQIAGADLSWPPGGPKIRWKRELGAGYSGIAVEGTSLYTMHRRDDQLEVVSCLDADTGKTNWEFSYDAPLPADYDRHNGTGPRVTPLIDENLMFTVGAGGKMHCIDRRTHKALWSKEFIADFGGSIRVNGYAPSVVGWRDTVIVMPNGPGAAIVALRKS